MQRYPNPGERRMGSKKSYRRKNMANILVIDDQPYIGELLSEDLADEGHRVTCVEDADYVISSIEESKPDIILLDLYLRGFEGWDLLDRIKRYDSTVPVLIVSAYDNFVNDPRLTHADGYFIKNINTDNLKQKIHENLTKSTLHPNI
jgi:two-component system, response regulator, stage 0 sporulation protein F